MAPPPLPKTSPSVQARTPQMADAAEEFSAYRVKQEYRAVLPNGSCEVTR